jgi:hypothetical protein
MTEPAPLSHLVLSFLPLELLLSTLSRVSRRWFEVVHSQHLQRARATRLRPLVTPPSAFLLACSFHGCTAARELTFAGFVAGQWALSGCSFAT